MAKTAYFRKDVSHNFQGQAEVFRCTPALGGHNYVLVSSIHLPREIPGLPTCETFIFGWDPLRNKVANWGELNGSTKGITDHDQALQNAGYTVER